MSIEESSNFEFPDGIVNAYEYNKVDKDGVSGISKRRELAKNEVILNSNQVEEINKFIEKIKELKLDLSKINLNHLKLPNLDFLNLSNLNKIKANDVCNRCPNHPNNGGSGMCNCTLPYINNPIT